ncbi:hypothetical protein [Arthrobacter sp. M4]|uniref:hypothetical protein n=1 Tax=Arthrobacter sp. M4 TaxID=218160 RepID=UPI001CDC627A|nr:hypothetical protein [Arthrobacter sp. M4]MCA4133993.1 hypothetical protein [Arthrobacter sp. M4]
MTEQSRNLSILAFSACLVMLTSCTQDKQKLSSPEACASLELVLHRAEVSWPVANQRITTSSSEAIIDGFEDVAVQTQGDMRATLDAWIGGFRLVSPYLVANDFEGAKKAINDVQEEIILLANTNLATLCHW